MGKYTVPKMEDVIELVKSHDKRVGLRMLYDRYSVPMGERHKYRALWNKFHEMLPDAFEKELEDASEDRETETDDGDCFTFSEEAVSEESQGVEDVQKPVA